MKMQMIKISSILLGLDKWLYGNDIELKPIKIFSKFPQGGVLSQLFLNLTEDYILKWLGSKNKHLI